MFHLWQKYSQQDKAQQQTLTGSDWWYRTEKQPESLDQYHSCEVAQINECLQYCNIEIVSAK